MKKILFILIIVFFIVPGALASEVHVDTWRIPFLNCVTGPIASIGEYMAWSARYAAEEINAAGGIKGRPVEIIIHDTGVAPDRGVEEMSKVVNDALVVMGPVPEAVIMAAVPIAVRHGLFAMTASTSYEYAVEYFPWTLSWYQTTSEALPPLPKAWAEANPEMKRVVQFVEKWATWPLMAEAHTTGLNQAGVEVIDIEVPVDAVTFGPLVVRALANNPDGILLACNAEKAAQIIRELVNRGWENKSQILVFVSADDTPLYTTGGEALEGITIYNYIDPTSEDPRWIAFRDAYREDHGGQMPGSLATNYYDAVYMISEAIANTDIVGDPSRLAEERILMRDYLRNIKNFEGIQLTWDMEEGVPTNKGAFLFVIENGEKQLLMEVN